MLDETLYALALAEDEQHTCGEADMSKGGGPAYAARSVLNTRDEQQDAYVALDLLVEVGFCFVWVASLCRTQHPHTSQRTREKTSHAAGRCVVATSLLVFATAAGATAQLLLARHTCAVPRPNANPHY
jgi:hypothetical protein